MVQSETYFKPWSSIFWVHKRKICLNKTCYFLSIFKYKIRTISHTWKNKKRQNCFMTFFFFFFHFMQTVFTKIDKNWLSIRKLVFDCVKTDTNTIRKQSTMQKKKNDSVVFLYIFKKSSNINNNKQTATCQFVNKENVNYVVLMINIMFVVQSLNIISSPFISSLFSPMSGKKRIYFYCWVQNVLNGLWLKHYFSFVVQHIVEIILARFAKLGQTLCFVF